MKVGTIYRLGSEVYPLLQILKNCSSGRYEVWAFYYPDDSFRSGWFIAFDGKLSDCKEFAREYGDSYGTYLD